MNRSRKPYDLDLNPIPRSRFTVCDGKLVSELSDVRDCNVCQRIYSDACDAGFSVLDRQGHPVRFALADEQRSPEGELQALLFTCIDQHRSRGITGAIIFND